MIDFENRLKSLKERRQGSRERAIFESMDSFAANQAILTGRDVRKREFFETLNESAGVKYAIGAMAAVDEAATKVSIREGERVADSLIKSLSSEGESVTKRLQGSVALDIHIKGHSDVDMLILVTNPVNVELPKVVPNGYLPSSDPRSLLQIIRDVRAKSERILPVNFPKANVDCSSSKCICVSGGSLAREVDVVPAIWFDTIKYQSSSQDHDRGVKIYNKSDDEFLLNFPFTHIKLVNDRDALYGGNLKSVIRLMKNMIADMPDYKKRVVKQLSSYDLAAIGYHMNENLYAPYYMKLSLVEKTRAHLAFLLAAKDYRSSLSVPDQSRKIFDNDGKVEALSILSKEMDDLAVSIFKELQPLRSAYDSSAILTKSIF
ncbi:TPA: hypothetical protein NID39_006055 [Pseudomonas aeruginosa]|jgi:hypothetical protein|uniref:hypothetical protein n=1 Tax=Pseudomonadaceae TaxID=135621 RepID=UPI000750782C|nr:MULTISPECIES: hypothetical protein [Pseudomonadaceae]MBA4682393.1 hypothetical protein [Pseudomonas sp.]ELJ2257110.1 hypothetical protein [Pseudomonas aeruginosa]ELP1402665.1 hypothetical protein [Pseudomonas aeruginosa]EMF0961857.1 hypothetical protein [Pseudomonas aeruginosa]MBX5763956.1 hypothetical protein [Pseudomonas aeruginosa]